jgi:hypothetical protein
MYVRALLWEEGKGQESFPVSGKAFGAFPVKERLRRKKGGVSRREAAVLSVPGITILRRGRARGELCSGTGVAAPSPGPSDGGWRGVRTACPGAEGRAGMSSSVQSLGERWFPPLRTAGGRTLSLRAPAQNPLNRERDGGRHPSVFHLNCKIILWKCVQ